jgi:hypothetical protein
VAVGDRRVAAGAEVAGAPELGVTLVVRQLWPPLAVRMIATPPLT